MTVPNISTTYTVANAANELTGILHGTSLNQITDLTDVWNRAARRVIQDVDPAETKMDIQFGQVFDGVFDYPLPTDVKGNKIIDIYPQANRQLGDNFGQTYNKNFDLWKNFTLVPDFTTRYSGGNRTIRINATDLHTGIQINAAASVTGNGTWAATGNASNIQTDNQYFTDGASGSVSISLNQTGVVGSTGTVANSTMGSVDLSTQYNNGTEFYWVYLPLASSITSVSLQLGSSTGNYYQFSAQTTDYRGNNFINGWNLIGALWSTATIVGTPVNTTINYIATTFTYDGTLQTQVRINQFWSRLGVIFNINYYSKYLFMDSATYAFKAATTTNNDYINLDIDGFNLFLYAAAIEAVQQQQGLSATFFDDPTLESKYSDALAEYQSKYKSEIIKPSQPYYTTPSQGYRRFFGRGSRNG